MEMNCLQLDFIVTVQAVCNPHFTRRIQMERMFSGIVAVELRRLECCTLCMASLAVCIYIDRTGAPGRGSNAAVAADIAAGLVLVDVCCP